ncbi:exopolysaccharide biosynthesis protein [Legionella israelensis]|uniref:exopolysaccharide biosynthesis protein n=1 Tax=Legionella israelensis TaxID=454 RepID=UPI00117E08E3|nr:exopolysaccharide biosynthesis protein [Legionella israelensis]QDP72107.1 exopolysaccharide biosynthesis protein [Legionella israelensis]
MKKNASEKLLEITRCKTVKENTCFEDILALLGERTYGIALLFFSLPSALPFSLIPGMTFIFSMPIFIFTIQMIFGRSTFWLPKIIAQWHIPYKLVVKIICTTAPYLKKAEFFIKPRWSFMLCRPMQIMNGLLIFCLTFLLILPIPFNFIFATLLIIFSLGMIEKDGAIIILGYIATVLYVSFISWFIMVVIKAIMTWVSAWYG